MGATHNLLLCGGAVTVCFQKQEKQTLSTGGLCISTLSHFSQSVENLLAKGSRIWVLSDDLKAFDNQYSLIEGVEVAESMAAICLEHDKVWFW